jgi:hypothetical protein
MVTPAACIATGMSSLFIFITVYLYDKKIENFWKSGKCIINIIKDSK